MAESLYPTETVTLEASELGGAYGSPIGYMPCVYFDEDLGDFVRDGQHKLKSSTRLEAWEQWCINCIMTERGAYPAYGNKFGISTYEAFHAEDRAEAESILTVEITEGLMNDPYGRTEYVESIEFDWIHPDAVAMAITVRGIEDVTIDITAYIDKRGR